MSATTPLRPTYVAIGSVQGTLALHIGDLHLDARHDPPEHLENPRNTSPAADVVPIDRAVRRRLAQWTHRYAQAVVEIVEGDRPVSQVLRWTVPDVYDDLARRAVLVARAAGHRPGQGRPPGPVVRAHVLGVRTSFVTPEKVEASVHVRHGERSRAIAARFELIADRWQCTALEFA
jgi:hypothetical protein